MDELIIVHAGLGGLALLSGLIALVTKKGSRIHKKSGITFFFSMLISALVSLIVSISPGHYNMFLFLIGLISVYFLLSGYLILKFKSSKKGLLVLKTQGLIMFINGAIMIVLSLLWFDMIKALLLIFGVLILFFGWKDWRLSKLANHHQLSWLKEHIGKMTAGYISCVTAFFVVNQFLPGIWNWILPGVVGSIYIIIQSKKIKT